MKKFVKSTVIATACIIILIIAAMLVFDPLFQYHLPLFGMNAVIENDEQYYVPGMAKNFSYTNAIIGNSLSENLRLSWLDEIFGGNTLRLTISGSYPVEYKKVLDIVLEKDEVKNIVMNVGGSFFYAEEGKGSWDNLPDYLYDDNVFNDVNYLLNKDIMFKYGLKSVLYNLKNKETDLETVFTWDKTSKFGKETVLAHYDTDFEAVDCDTLERYKQNRMVNLDFLCNLAEENPDVTFTIFVPPMSMLWWNKEVNIGLIDYWRETYLQFADKMTQYGNVELYFFANQRSLDIISDIDNYKDTSHYNLDTSKYISECFASKENLLTKNNYAEVLNGFFDFVEAFDYSTVTQ